MTDECVGTLAIIVGLTIATCGLWYKQKKFAAYRDDQLRKEEWRRL